MASYTKRKVILPTVTSIRKDRREKELIEKNNIDEEVSGLTSKILSEKQFTASKKKEVEDSVENLKSVEITKYIDNYDKIDSIISSKSNDIDVSLSEITHKSESLSASLSDNFSFNVDMIELERLIKTKGYNTVSKNKIKSSDDINGVTVTLPNDPSEIEQNYRRLDPDLSSSRINDLVTLSSDIKEVLLLQFSDLDVEYRNESLENNDIGAFILKMMINSSNMSLNFNITNTLLSSSKYGSAISSEGSINMDSKLSLNIYRSLSSNVNFVTIKREDDSVNPITLDIQYNLLLGGNIRDPKSVEPFDYIKSEMKLIGTALIEKSDDGVIGAMNTDIIDRDYFNDMITQIHTADSDIFGKTVMVKLSSIDIDTKDVERNVIIERDIDSIKGMKNALLELPSVISPYGEKRSFEIPQFIDNVNDCYVYHKEAQMLYLCTSQGLMIYNYQTDKWIYENEDGKFIDLYGIPHRVKIRTLRNMIHLLTDKGSFIAEVPIDNGIIPVFQKDELDFYTRKGVDYNGQPIGDTHPSRPDLMKNNNFYGVKDYECSYKEYSNSITSESNIIDLSEYESFTSSDEDDMDKIVDTQFYEIPYGLEDASNMATSRQYYKSKVISITRKHNGKILVKNLDNRYSDESEVQVGTGLCDMFSVGFFNFTEHRGIIATVNNNRVYVSYEGLVWTELTIPSCKNISKLVYLSTFTPSTYRGEGYINNKEHLYGGTWVLVDSPVEDDKTCKIYVSQDMMTWDEYLSSELTVVEDFSVVIGDTYNLNDGRNFGVMEDIYDYENDVKIYSNKLNSNYYIKFKVEDGTAIIENKESDNLLKEALSSLELADNSVVVDVYKFNNINREDIRLENITHALKDISLLTVKNLSPLEGDLEYKTIAIEHVGDGAIELVNEGIDNNDVMITRGFIADTISGQIGIYLLDVYKTSTGYKSKLNSIFGDNDFFYRTSIDDTLRRIANGVYDKTSSSFSIGEGVIIRTIAQFFNGNSDDKVIFHSNTVDKQATPLLGVSTASIEATIPFGDDVNIEDENGIINYYSEIEVYNIYTKPYVSTDGVSVEEEKIFVYRVEHLYSIGSDGSYVLDSINKQLIQRNDTIIASDLSSNNYVINNEYKALIKSRYNNNCEDLINIDPVSVNINPSKKITSLSTKNISFIPYMKDSVEDIAVIINYMTDKLHDIMMGESSSTHKNIGDSYFSRHPLRYAKPLYELGPIMITGLYSKDQSRNYYMEYVGSDRIHEYVKPLQKDMMFDGGFHVNMGICNYTYNPDEQYIVDSVYGRVYAVKEIDGTSTYIERRVLEVDNEVNKDYITNLVDFKQFHAYLVNDKYYNMFYEKDIMENYSYRDYNDLKNMSNMLLVNMYNDDGSYRIFGVKTSINMYYDIKTSIEMDTSVVDDDMMLITSPEGNADNGNTIYNMLEKTGMPIGVPCKCTGFVYFNNKQIPVEQVMINNKVEAQKNYGFDNGYRIEYKDRGSVIFLLDRKYKFNDENIVDLVHQDSNKTFSRFPGIILGEEGHKTIFDIDVDDASHISSNALGTYHPTTMSGDLDHGDKNYIYVMMQKRNLNVQFMNTQSTKTDYGKKVYKPDTAEVYSHPYDVIDRVNVNKNGGIIHTKYNQNKYRFMDYLTRKMFYNRVSLNHISGMNGEVPHQETGSGFHSQTYIDKNKGKIFYLTPTGPRLAQNYIDQNYNFNRKIESSAASFGPFNGWQLSSSQYSRVEFHVSNTNRFSIKDTSATSLNSMNTGVMRVLSFDDNGDASDVSRRNGIAFYSHYYGNKFYNEGGVNARHTNKVFDRTDVFAIVTANRTHNNWNDSKLLGDTVGVDTAKKFTLVDKTKLLKTSVMFNSKFSNYSHRDHYELDEYNDTQLGATASLKKQCVVKYNKGDALLVLDNDIITVSYDDGDTWETYSYNNQIKHIEVVKSNYPDEVKDKIIHGNGYRNIQIATIDEENDRLFVIQSHQDLYNSPSQVPDISKSTDEFRLHRFGYVDTVGRNRHIKHIKYMFTYKLKDFLHHKESSFLSPNIDDNVEELSVKTDLLVNNGIYLNGEFVQKIEKGCILKPFKKILDKNNKTSYFTISDDCNTLYTSDNGADWSVTYIPTLIGNNEGKLSYTRMCYKVNSLNIITCVDDKLYYILNDIHYLIDIEYNKTFDEVFTTYDEFIDSKINGVKDNKLNVDLLLKKSGTYEYCLIKNSTKIEFQLDNIMDVEIEDINYLTVDNPNSVDELSHMLKQEELNNVVSVRKNNTVIFFKTKYVDSNNMRVYYVLDLDEIAKTFMVKSLNRENNTFITYNESVSYEIFKNGKCIKYISPYIKHEYYGDKLTLVDEQIDYMKRHRLDGDLGKKSITREDAISKNLYEVKTSKIDDLQYVETLDDSTKILKGVLCLINRYDRIENYVWNRYGVNTDSLPNVNMSEDSILDICSTRETEEKLDSNSLDIRTTDTGILGYEHIFLDRQVGTSVIDYFEYNHEKNIFIMMVAFTYIHKISSDTVYEQMLGFDNSRFGVLFNLSDTSNSKGFFETNNLNHAYTHFGHLYSITACVIGKTSDDGNVVNYSNINQAYDDDDKYGYKSNAYITTQFSNRFGIINDVIKDDGVYMFNLSLKVNNVITTLSHIVEYGDNGEHTCAGVINTDKNTSLQMIDTTTTLFSTLQLDEEDKYKMVIYNKNLKNYDFIANEVVDLSIDNTPLFDSENNFSNTFMAGPLSVKNTSSIGMNPDNVHTPMPRQIIGNNHNLDYGSIESYCQYGLFNIDYNSFNQREYNNYSTSRKLNPSILIYKLDMDIQIHGVNMNGKYLFIQSGYGIIVDFIKEKGRFTSYSIRLSRDFTKDEVSRLWVSHNTGINYSIPNIMSRDTTSLDMAHQGLDDVNICISFTEKTDRFSNLVRDHFYNYKYDYTVDHFSLKSYANTNSGYYKSEYVHGIAAPYDIRRLFNIKGRLFGVFSSAYRDELCEISPSRQATLEVNENEKYTHTDRNYDTMNKIISSGVEYERQDSESSGATWNDLPEYDLEFTPEKLGGVRRRANISKLNGVDIVLSYDKVYQNMDPRLIDDSDKTEKKRFNTRRLRRNGEERTYEYNLPVYGYNTQNDS